MLLYVTVLLLLSECVFLAHGQTGSTSPRPQCTFTSNGQRVGCFCDTPLGNKCISHDGAADITLVAATPTLLAAGSSASAARYCQISIPNDTYVDAENRLAPLGCDALLGFCDPLVNSTLLCCGALNCASCTRYVRCDSCPRDHILHNNDCLPAVCGNVYDHTGHYHQLLCLHDINRRFDIEHDVWHRVASLNETVVGAHKFNGSAWVPHNFTLSSAEYWARFYSDSNTLELMPYAECGQCGAASCGACSCHCGGFNNEQCIPLSRVGNLSIALYGNTHQVSSDVFRVPYNGSVSWSASFIGTVGHWHIRLIVNGDTVARAELLWSAGKRSAGTSIAVVGGDLLHITAGANTPDRWQRQINWQCNYRPENVVELHDIGVEAVGDGCCGGVSGCSSRMGFSRVLPTTTTIRRTLPATSSSQLLLLSSSSSSSYFNHSAQRSTRFLPIATSGVLTPPLASTASDTTTVVVVVVCIVVCCSAVAAALVLFVRTRMRSEDEQQVADDLNGNIANSTL
jgi:hypothetical protein